MTSCQRIWFLFSFPLILGFSGELFAQQSTMPEFEMTLNAETGVICHREPSGENACTQCTADGLCNGIFEGAEMSYSFFLGNFSELTVINVDGVIYHFDATFDAANNLYIFVINGFNFAYFPFNPNVGLYVIDPARICWECLPSTAVCGNGIIEWPEQCDDANDDLFDGCVECRFISATMPVCMCGNGRIENEETAPSCGDLTPDEDGRTLIDWLGGAPYAWPEECDPGLEVDPTEGCTADCRLCVPLGEFLADPGQECCGDFLPDNLGICGGGCGNGVIDTNTEECDDGNAIDDDSCNTECRTPCGSLPLTFSCPSTTWTRIVPSGIGSAVVGMNDLALDREDNVYLVGTVYASGISPAEEGNNILVQKYDRCGFHRWTRTINGPTDGFDGGAGITTDNDGNIYVAGELRASDGSLSGIIRKYNSCGGEIWSQYPAVSSVDDVTLDPFDNLFASAVVVFGSGSDSLGYWIGKFDSFAGLAAPPPWPLSGSFFFGSVNNTDLTTDSAGNIYIAGTDSGSTLSATAWILKLLPSGSPDPTFGDDGVASVTGTPGSEGIRFYEISLGPDENIYVAGYESVYPDPGGGEGNATLTWLGKLGPTGVWAEAPFPIIDNVLGLAQTFGLAIDTGGNIYVTGLTAESDFSNCVIFLRKYGPSGEILWTDLKSVTGGDQCLGSEIEIGTDNSLYLSAFERPNILISKYTPCGVSDDGPPDEQLDPSCP